MKKLSVLVATVIVAMGASFTSCGDSHKSASLKTSIDSASYAIGISTGAGYKENLKTLPGGEANVDDLIAGFIQAIKGDSSAMKMNPQQAQQYLQTYFVEAQAREAKKTKEEGDKFLAENKTKEGVITTESGLQYKVEKEGTGAKPTATDKVKVHYTGTLLDGTKFDSSVDRGEPAEFGVGQVIKGWTEGLQIMPVGSKYIFWIPAELAYGERGAGQDIKPNSTLKFEIELLDIAGVLQAARCVRSYGTGERQDKTSIDYLFSALQANRFLEEKITTAILDGKRDRRRGLARACGNSPPQARGGGQGPPDPAAHHFVPELPERFCRTR